MTDMCDICGFDTEPDNLIVYCESCNMGVHQNCYGISQVCEAVGSRRVLSRGRVRRCYGIQCVCHGCLRGDIA